MDNPTDSLIFKIVPRDQWEAARKAGVFRGAPIDVTDGYIHLSTARQVRQTAAKHFADCDDLLLIAVEVQRIADALKWEPSRGGDLFPHLYDDLHFSAIVWEEELPLEQGTHVFPSQVDLPQ